MSEIVEIEDKAGVRWLRLNRPEIGNAFDDRVIHQLSDAVVAAGQDPAVHVLALGGRGKHFSAGADFHWMQRMVELSYEENVADALRLAQLMKQIHDCPKVTIAAVHGAAFGGALGLICACDVAFAAESATFCLSEVKLGLIPAVISPYVIAAMGRREASRWFLTADTFDAPTARAIGVVHDVVAPENLAATVEAWAHRIGNNGPVALGEAKRLIRDVAGQPIDDAIGKLTAERVARIRVSPEGQEGLRAFLGKREPSWRRKE